MTSKSRPDRPLRIDLHGAFLRKVTLTDANFARANMSTTDCTRADFTRANLVDANFTDANLVACIN